MTTGTETPSYSIAVLDRSLDVLEELATSSDARGITEIAHAIGATKSSTFRILATLENRGYVFREPDSGKYRLGTSLFRLGQRSLESVELRSVARPVLENLHHRFNETVNLGTLVEQRIVYVDMIESDRGLRMSARVGAQDEVHSTAIGKAILAYISDERLEKHLERPLPRLTPNTITDPEALREELAQIRTSGFSRDRGENEEGASCFGAPVFDHRGEVVAGLSVSGPEGRLAGEVAQDVAVAVRAAAQHVTERLGGRAPE